MKTKRAFAWIILVTMLMMPMCSALAVRKGTVRGGWLILRSGPSFNAKVKASYPTGSVVTITGTAGEWYRVTASDGLQGYMLGKYLRVTEEGPSSGGSTAYVTSGNGLNVRLRTGPDTGYPVLASYAPGTRCTILSAGSTWSCIRVGNSTGYMMSRFLTASDPSLQPAVVPTEPVNAGSVWVTSRNGKGVNLRSGPAKAYPSLGVYPVGTQVQMVSIGSQWSYVRIREKNGYMMTEFLSSVSPAPSPAPAGPYVTSANGKNVNLRTGPGKQYGVVRSFAVGTPLAVVTPGQWWSYIQIGNTYGYMMNEFIGNYSQQLPSPATQTDLY